MQPTHFRFSGCGPYILQKIFTMSNNRYNPIASAFSAAWSELSSDKAKAFYVRRSFEDAFALVGVVSALALAAYALGVQVRNLVNDLEGSKTKSEPMATIPCIAGLLMSAKDDTGKPAVTLVNPVNQAFINEQWMLNQIRSSAIALDLVNKMEATDKALEVAATPKDKRTRSTSSGTARKAKTETTGKPSPKGRKSAGIAPRKSPSLARVGNYVASID
jgi:hypothetical protein